MINSYKLLKPIFSILVFVFMVGKADILLGQDTGRVTQKYLFFPYPMEKNWQISLGWIMTALPEETTEEVQVRAPAIDLHAIRKLSKSTYLDGRLQTQFVQSHIAVGLRWAHVYNQRWSFSLGDDLAYWFGKLEAGSFDTKGNGWQNFPNASLGYRFKDKVLLTLKGEALLNLNYKTSIAKEITESKGFEFSGWAGSVLLEQRFGKKLHVVTGFRGQYTSFFWQTWPLFETFDRRIFYPELLVGFIL